MPESLATTDDLEDMWRPLADSETERAANLLAKASALLRQAAPHIDARIAAFTSDPTDVTALDPQIAATVVATIVKRFIANVEGVASQSVGPYSVSYVLRGEKDARGELQVTDSDLAALRPYQPKAKIGSIRVRPSMAPPPAGRLGGVVLATTVDLALLETGVEPIIVEAPVPIGYEDGFGG